MYPPMQGTEVDDIERPTSVAEGVGSTEATARRSAIATALVAFARSWFEPGKLLLATRLPVLAAMYLSLVLAPLEAKPGMWRSKPDNLFIDGWLRWDAGWYGHLATDGYTNIPNGDGQRDVAFWPLYPLLLRLSAWVFRTPDLATVSVVMNFVLLAGATWFFYGLASRRLGAETASLSTLLFLTYPYSIYYNAGYSEATYLFFTLGAFYFADRERWAAAAMLCGIGTAARGVAFTTALGIAIVYLEKKRFRLRDVRADVLWLLLAGSGWVAYTAFLWRAFGQPFAYVASYTSRGWGADVTSQRLFDTVRALWRPEDWPAGHVRIHDLLCITAFAAVALLTLVGLVVRRTSGADPEGPRSTTDSVTTPVGGRPVLLGETAFAIGSLFVYAKMWPTSGRYVGTIFPVYLTLASLLTKRPALRAFVLTSFVVLMTLFTSTFGHWGWLSG